MELQRADSAASAFKAALDLRTASFRLRLASRGIATAAANKIPIPFKLRWASRYPTKFKTEVSMTSPAIAKSKALATRGARASSM